MRFRGKSIRRKIVALLLVPLVSLTALWALATTLTGSDAKRLLDVGYVIGKVGGPVEDTIRVVQNERRQTLIYLADPRAPDARVTLQKSRTDTDRVAARVKANATPDVRSDLDSVTAQQLTAVIGGLDDLATTRRSVDNNKISRSGALDFYSRIVDPGFTFLATLHGLQEVDADNWGRALIGMSLAREMLSREDALVTSALMTGSINAQEIRRVSDLVANRTLLYRTNLSDLPARDRAILEQYWRTPSTLTLGSTEDSLITAGAGASPAVIDVAGWQKLTGPVLDDLHQESNRADTLYAAHIDPLRTGTYFRAGLASVLGFLALLVSVIVSVRVSRDLIRDLSQLRKEAHEVSGVRLPSVMRRLAAGEQVDVETEAPRLDYEKDEVGQVGQALNTLQRAAVEAAVKQADLRRGVSEVFVNLARRNQVLLHRQLTLLDTMERRTEDTEELADLFRLDHLTTRMRRHAEGLVILSGAAPSRQWRKPVQLMDVVRAAVAEVEDYERIEVRRLPRIGVGGPAVADLTHLIAELLENATVFSPPHTAVQVHGERVANGFTLEIHDRGLGMAPEMLLDANLRLAETPEFELSDTDRLGLFVVSRLAQRQNVRVSLQPSPYGGTTAVVFLPVALLTDAPETEGVGFRLDRKGTAERGRGRAESGSTGRLTALAQMPAGLGSGPSVLDGPVELEPPVGPLGRDTRPIRGGGDGIAGLEDPDSERGGLFRAREHLRDLDLDLGLGGRDAGRDTGESWQAREDVRLSHDEVRPARDGVRSARDEAREARDRRDGRPPTPEPHDLHEPYEPRSGPASGGSDDPLSLPRRKPPTLVADRGRRVDETGRTRAESARGAAEPPSGGPLSGVPAPLRGRPAAARGDARTDRTTGADRAGRADPTAEAPDLLGGLPRRVRQASLAPQLRDSAPERAPGQAPAGRQDGERDADEVRNRMASLQRGWQRGRRQNDAEETTRPGETDRTTSEGDGR
ncbi:nitrate- and nitrite sensing domain-containing protein [Streptomyces sp. NPDC006638]|uniref:sensor histidine kinase n=1 Tax=Streptomyces sp. NPDC006638 TaxID=3157183 RepID=UPI0033A41C38